MTELVLAIDGGNFKTDLALVETSGRLVSLVRGGRSSPHFVGVEGCVELLERLLGRALSDAGLDHGHDLRAGAAQVMVAGADLPEELDALRARIDALHWSDRLVVDNDTFALLRSGTDRGWGVAVVCGAGINCVGVAPGGRQLRFPALGAITGDWGGGYDVGLGALVAAARSADGRGPRTVLERAVPAHYGLQTPFDVGRAVHLRELPSERLGELSRVVFAAAGDDAVAALIVDRLAGEVTALATAALRRLELTAAGADVVLGGSLMRAAPRGAIELIETGIHEVARTATVLVAPAAPILGAALLGLDALGADAHAAVRVRAELDAALNGGEPARSLDG